MRNNLNFSSHQRCILYINIFHFFIFYTPVATDKSINMFSNKDMHTLQNLGASFNPVSVEINRDAES